MNCDKNSLLLYAVTDRAWLQPGETLLGRVRDAIEGGATFVQLREKDLDPAAFLAEGREIGALCREMGVPFVVDDDVDLALACGADGAHVGQSDLAAGEAHSATTATSVIEIAADGVTGTWNYENRDLSGNAVVLSILMGQTELYRSESIAPGERIEEIRLSQPLSAGAYEAVAVTAIYDADGNYLFANRIPVTLDVAK